MFVQTSAGLKARWKKKQLENLLLITAKHYHVENILKFHAEIPDMYSQNSYILLVPATSQILTKQ